MKKFPIVKSRRLRSTPYTDRIEAHGVSSYTVYNHMLLPASFKSLESDYHHLKEFVQVWDVAAERQVEITGKDSAKLVQLMTCRDLSKSKIGRCYYSPLVDQEGLLVNDPIINKLAEDRWWISIADSDVIFFAKGIASGNKFEVEIKEPNVNILAVQGPLAENLMAKLFGEEIRDLKFFNFKYFNYKEHKYFIARSGWSKQGGFEVYVEDDIAGQDLYDYLFEFGKEFNIRPGCPNLIERIESALLSYGNDFDNRDNPFEANFDKFVNLDSDVNFLGKEKLKKIQQDGITRKLMGVKIDSNKIDMYCEKTLFDDKNNIVGYVRSATYSPTFKKVIGIAMINKPYWNSKDQFKIDIDERIFVGTVCDLPFI
jgi:dimethylsulfoniopropionate demethylase|tara:strand:- start:1972 stop:3081 length:1110 start_codon:yes stop_codon:yes gene_type:complete